MPCMHTETLLAHLGDDNDPTGALIPPIYPSVAYARPAADQPGTWNYSRSSNPTRAALEQALATLHHGSHASAFGSGMAAVTTVAMLLKPGDVCVFPDDMYGTTYYLYTHTLKAHGLQPHFVNMTDAALLRREIEAKPALVWIETPTNPSLHIVDLQAAADVARRAGVLTAVDNSFASPYLQCPLDFGIDLVMESTTKFLNGHDDLMGGALITKDAALAERIHSVQTVGGAVPSPNDCWLLLRGMKTLGLRMERQQRNAGELARWLSARSEVGRVCYPGLPDHPGHELAKRQMSGFGAMLSFTLRGGAEAARAVCGKTKLFSLAGGLGGVASLIAYPYTMSQSHQVGTPQAPDPAMVRLSVGIEHEEDLIADLERALAG